MRKVNEKTEEGFERIELLDYGQQNFYIATKIRSHFHSGKSNRLGGPSHNGLAL